MVMSVTAHALLFWPYIFDHERDPAEGIDTSRDVMCCIEFQSPPCHCKLYDLVFAHATSEEHAPVSVEMELWSCALTRQNATSFNCPDSDEMRTMNKRQHTPRRRPPADIRFLSQFNTNLGSG
jgi:hypothetical protein